ncbi:MAG: hypothetical protein KJ621_15225 [Proteobacteria bacterium]|nr:hypothetical protein [Pseudomonadota bacterium]
MNGSVSRAQRPPLYVEVITRVLTISGSTSPLELLLSDVASGQDANAQINQYPREMKEEYLRLSDWIRKLSTGYGHRILIKIIDAHTPLGLYKAVRYRFRKTPTFIVNGRHKYTGWDEQRLEIILNWHLARAEA